MYYEYIGINDSLGVVNVGNHYTKYISCGLMFFKLPIINNSMGAIDPRGLIGRMFVDCYLLNSCGPHCLREDNFL